MNLKIDDFEEFFKAVHDGRSPFKWQSKLAEQVCKNGRWPKALDLPTASGKTAVIDIAIFHLALESEKNDRNASLRIALVVDRRLVVDHAYDHAMKLSKAIRGKSSHILEKIANSLEKISSDILKVVKLRGGMPQEGDWATTPSTPTIIISTIDQVGSRLLFRGYGVSNNMKPIHAGLLGSDTLYLLDEAHISQPFIETLEKISKIQKERKWRQSFTAMFMSATLPPNQKDVFPLTKDKKELLEDMGKRVSAHKFTEIKSVNEIEEECVNIASQIIKKPGAKELENINNIGIIVNRVKSARKIFSEIKKNIEKYNEMNHSNNEVHLLIGRIRPLDRDIYLKEKINKIKSDAKNIDQTIKFFVCTQCVEVGADITFDKLITQIASLDSLRQRFGRLNRIGEHENSTAIIIASKENIKKNSDDRIYKKTLGKTWKYLVDNLDKDKKIDFGIKYFKEPKSDELADMIAPKAESVTILPTYLHFWYQTSPPPVPDPDPALFLHGVKSKSADVQIIWRSSITKEMLEANNQSKREQIFESLNVIPSALETISVPIWDAKKLINKYDKDTELSDLETGNYPDGNVKENKDEQNNDNRVLRWKGIKNIDTHSVKISEIKPGDTIIIPTDYGGCDEYGWDENYNGIVKDISIESNLIQRKHFAILFDEKIIKKISSVDIWGKIKKMTQDYAESHEKFFNELKNIENASEGWKEIMSEVNKDYVNKKIQIQIKEENGSMRISGFSYKKRISQKYCNNILDKLFNYHKIDEDYDELESSTDQNFNTGSTEILLDNHSKGVENFVQKFISTLNFGSEIKQDLKLAAKLHDIGKKHPGMQALLQRKDPDELIDKKFLAKSTYKISSPQEYQKYLKKAKLPKYFRHECWSVALAKKHPEFKAAHDKELVQYLIGTHHGRGRPIFPRVIDEYQDISANRLDIDIKDIPNGLDLDWINICMKLYRKYGPWELGYMEAIIRLADHRQSKEENK